QRARAVRSHPVGVLAERTKLGRTTVRFAGAGREVRQRLCERWIVSRKLSNDLTEYAASLRLILGALGQGRLLPLGSGNYLKPEVMNGSYRQVPSEHLLEPTAHLVGCPAGIGEKQDLLRLGQTLADDVRDLGHHSGGFPGPGAREHKVILLV